MQKENISRTSFVKGVTACVVVAASLGSLSIKEYSTAMKNSQHDFVPGTYSAAAQGMDGDVTVSITVDESTITDIQVDVSGETPGIGAEIGDEVTTQILTAQSSDIAGVSGATVSSTAVKEALDAAIANAEAGSHEGEPTPSTEEEATEAKAQTEKTAEEAATEGEAVAAGSYTAGTYTATAKGIESDVKVEGTFDENGLTDLSVDVSGETAGLGADIGDKMVEAVMAAQSADVDGVAGATISSDTVKTAVADIFAQAAGGAATEDVAEEVTEKAAEAAGSFTAGTYKASAKGIESDVKVEATFDGSALTDLSVDVSGETPGLGADIGDKMVDAVMAAQSADVDGVAGATITSDAVKAAVADVFAQAQGGAEAATEAAAEAKAQFTPGTYEGKAKGIESDVVVKITVDESKITKIELDVSGETKGLGAEIGDEMVDQFLKAQSADVDGVSGSTITSKAAIEAMTQALEEAAK